MALPKRTVFLLLGLGLTILLTSSLFVIPRFMPAPKPVPQPENPPQVPADADFTPRPTLAVPSGLKYPLTAQILETINVSLSEVVGTSTDDEPKKRDAAFFKLRAGFESLVEAKLKEDPPTWKTLAECFGQASQVYKDSLKEASDLAEAKMAPKDFADGFYSPLNLEHSDLKEVPGNPDLAVLTIGADVPCGEDDAFYLFQKKDNQYRLVLHQVDNDEKSSGQEALDFGISPPDGKGDYFVVTHCGHPWCTSCWGGLNLEVYRPGPDADHPKVLLTSQQFIYRCGEPSLAVGKDDFQLTYTGSQTLDVDVLTRTYVSHYRVDGDKMVRVGPLGNYPEDFLDEWIGLDWEEAQTFCSPALKDWHDRMQKSFANSSALTKIDLVQPCPGSPERWEVGILTTDPALPSNIYYFEITKKNGDFFLEDISNKRKGDCPGNAKPEPHHPDMG